MITELIFSVNPGLLLIFTFATIYLTRRFILYKRYKLPPGPWALPIIGNYKEAFANLAYKRWTHELRQKYGDIFMIYAGRQPTIIVNNYDLAVEAFVTKYPKELSGRPYFKLFYENSEKGNDIAMANYGPRWKYQRKMAHSALRKFMQGLKVEVANINSFNKFVEDLKVGEPIELIEPLYHLTFNVMCGVLFSEIYSVNDAEFDEVAVSMKNLNVESLKVLYVEILPFLYDCPLQGVKNVKKLIQKILNYIQRKTEEHRNTLGDEPRDICDCFLIEINQNNQDSQTLNEVQIRQTLNDLLFAGTDTTRGTLHWLIGLLASYPQIQEKVFQEIVTFKNSLQPPVSEPVSLDWKDHLPYTNATINEVFRYSSIAPRGIAHYTMGDCKIGGYDVPKGYDVILNQYAFHYDPKYWSEPDKFNPQRFLDSDGKLISKVSGLAPFSFGHRVCLGESVAKADIFLMTVLLCSNYEFVWYEGNKDRTITLSDESIFEQIPTPFKVIFKER